MIVGTGVDLLYVSRMTRPVRNDHFLARVFVEEERAYIDKAADRAATAAGLFCAREAYVKALGRGLLDVSFDAYWVSHTEDGRPFFRFRAPDVTLAAHRTITHERDLAMAFVVLERR